MSTPRIAWISKEDPPQAFPHLSAALSEPDGLLAAGGDLRPDRLLYAYRHGIFPWFDSGQPILWWSPDPRCVMLPGGFHVSRSLRRFARNSGLDISCNTAFSKIIRACAAKRVGQQGTWITEDMIDAYTALHRQGWAHSVEVWRQDQMVGGLYGLAIGKAFFGESMFSAESNASKIAMWWLMRQLDCHGFEVFDCQVVSAHLASLGAVLMPRRQFGELLERACNAATQFSDWPQGHVSVADALAA